MNLGLCTNGGIPCQHRSERLDEPIKSMIKTAAGRKNKIGDIGLTRCRKVS